MMEQSKIDKQIQDDLDKGLIKYKKNSQSIEYKYFDIIDKNEDGTDKKYFELSDLMKDEHINKYIVCYIVNSKKGIGKTFQMKKLMEECNANGNYFMYVRRLEPDIKNQKSEWNLSAKDWPFYIKGKDIFRKSDNEYVGRVSTVTTLYSETGLEFPNFKYVFFDEFKDKRSGTRYVNGEFKKFVKFLADFQRNKQDSKVFMFSNDETKYDPYTEGLQIDPDNDYFIDLHAGVFYINLRDKFKGAISGDNSLTRRLGRYDKDLMNELDNNETVYDDSNNMVGYSKSKINEIQYQFYLNKRLYIFGVNDVDKILIIKSINVKQRDMNKLTYALTTSDYIAFENTTRPFNIENLIKTWYNLMNKQLLFFSKYDDKVEVEQFISRVLGVVRKKQY